MNKPLIIGLALLSALACGALLMLKIEVGQRSDRLQRIAEQIAADKRDIRVLETELAYLKSPQRLEPKAIDLLGLMPIEPKQVISSPRAIPLKASSKDLGPAPVRDQQKREQGHE